MTVAAKSQPGLITIAQAAALLEITDRYVRKLIAEGHIPKPQRNMVPLVGAVQGYCRFLKNEERRASKTAAAADVQKARAEEIRLRIAREQSKLIETDGAVAAFADCLGTLRYELEGVAAAATRDLGTRERIKSLQNEAFGRAQRKFSAKKAALQSKSARGIKK